MKGKTWIMILLLAAALGLTVYLPIQVFHYQDKELLEKVHTEAVKDQDLVDLISENTIEKLTIISSAEAGAYNTIMAEAASSSGADSEQITGVVKESLKDLYQKTGIPELELEQETTVIDSMRITYADTETQKSAICYNITVKIGEYEIMLKMDGSTGKIYSIGVYAVSVDVLLNLPPNIAETWGEYLDIPLTKAEGVSYDKGDAVYRVGESDCYYAFSGDTEKNVIYIQYMKGASKESLGVDVRAEAN